LPDAERLALPGVEAIDIDLREPTARLTLNAVNTTFASAIADDSAERADVVLGAEDLKTRALPAIEA
jgi:aminopeptidase N